jgi:hypothetical protein
MPRAGQVRLAGRLWGLPLFLLLAASLAAADDPDQVLQAALARLHSIVSSLPKYACVETVERRYFKPPRKSASASAASSCSQPAAGDETGNAELESVDRLRRAPPASIRATLPTLSVKVRSEPALSLLT